MAEPYMWPAGLPQSPRRSAYSRGLANNTTRSAMEYGPAKTRRRSSAQPGVLSATYTLRENAACPASGDPVNQKEVFEQFYAQVDCDLSFWLPDPEDKTRYILVKIMASGDEQGVSLTPYALNVWSVTLKLEVHPLVPPKPRT